MNSGSMVSKDAKIDVVDVVDVEMEVEEEPEHL